MEKKRNKKGQDQRIIIEGERNFPSTRASRGNGPERSPSATLSCAPCVAAGGGVQPDSENHPLTFEDWQQVLRLRADQENQAKLQVLQNEIETDTCFQHTDKRRRISPDECEDKKQENSVPSAISSDSRSYRHQQESRGSSNECSNTSVEPKWSDSDEDITLEELEVLYATDTESLSTVLSQQMDCVSLSNNAETRTRQNDEEDYY